MKYFFLPPISLILAVLVTDLAAWGGSRTCRVFATLFSLALYALSTPYVGLNLLHSLEPPYTGDPPAGWQRAGAIVVLSANWQDNAPEYEGITVGDMTLVRLRYVAKLARRTGLPVLVTGGPRTDGTGLVIADVMAKTLSDDFGVDVKFVEGRAFNTYESALYSSQMLRQAGFDTALVVTHAWHIPRTQLSFDKVGFSMLAAPTSFTMVPAVSFSDFFPSLKGITSSFYYFHEKIGIYYYKYFSQGVHS